MLPGEDFEDTQFVLKCIRRVEVIALTGGDVILLNALLRVSCGHSWQISFP
jgi:hypothetical protein